MDYRATILLYLELLFALFLLWREGLLKTPRQRFAGVTLAAFAFVLRYCCLPYETLDYQDWLRVWLSSLRENGAWRGLGQEIWSCNYNVPYLYFLALISRSSIPELLLIKLVSIFFDVLTAFYVSRIVSLFTDSPARKLAGFLGVLWLPTVYLNGAFWGQCDVIYASFAVLAVYLALSDRPVGSVAAIAVSVSFKLQGIFLMPAYLVFLFAGKVKVRHLFVFPVVYILTILPAVLAGRDFGELLTLYYNNTSTIGDGLNYNSSSLYALFDFSAMDPGAASRIGIFLAFFFCASIYIWMLLRREELDNRVLLGVSLLFCLGVPFLLPHMHDRYFFLADVLTFALAVIAPRMAPVPLLVSFGSFLGYHAYLRMRYLLPMRWGALAMLLALLLILGYTVHALSRPEPQKNMLTNPPDLV